MGQAVLWFVCFHLSALFREIVSSHFRATIIDKRKRLPVRLPSSELYISLKTVFVVGEPWLGEGSWSLEGKRNSFATGSPQGHQGATESCCKRGGGLCFLGLRGCHLGYMINICGWEPGTLPFPPHLYPHGYAYLGIECCNC